MIPVPEMKLDVVDAAELAEMLQFLSQWLARDPGRLASPWHSSSAIPPTAWPSCVMTWSGSSSCSAAATASPSLTLARLSKAPHHDQPAGSESTGFAAAHPRARRAAAGPSPGFDKGTLARTLIGPCGQVVSPPDRRQAYGSSPLIKSLHRQRRRACALGRWPSQQRPGHGTPALSRLTLRARARTAQILRLRQARNHGAGIPP